GVGCVPVARARVERAGRDHVRGHLRPALHRLLGGDRLAGGAGRSTGRVRPRLHGDWPAVVDPLFPGNRWPDGDRPRPDRRRRALPRTDMGGMADDASPEALPDARGGPVKRKVVATLVIVALVLPVAALAAMIGQQEWLRSQATVLNVAVRGVDPRDLLRG